MPQALRLCEPVLRNNLLKRPSIQRTDGYRQELFVGDQSRFLESI
jgi:hypothetical protein